MKILKAGSARGLTLSRIEGVKVEMEGRTAFVPIEGGPFELKRLTMGQINAIPKDRFAVSLIDVPTTITVGRPGCRGKLTPSLLEVQRYRRIGRVGKLIRKAPTGYIRKSPLAKMPDDDGTGTYTVAVADIDELKELVEKMFRTNRQLSRKDSLARRTASSIVSSALSIRYLTKVCLLCSSKASFII